MGYDPEQTMKPYGFLALAVLGFLTGCGGGGSTPASDPPELRPTLAIQSTAGAWTTRQEQMPLNPVHAIVLKTGNVLYISGSGNCKQGDPGCYPVGSNGYATIWNPTTGAFTTFTLPYDMFCNGAVQTADGRVFIAGGTLTYAAGGAAAIMRAMGHGKTAPGGAISQAAENTAGHKVPADATAAKAWAFGGERQATMFDPADNSFHAVHNMAAGRWYPTTTILGNGDILVQSGQDENSNDNGLMEQWSVKNNAWQQIVPTCSDAGPIVDCRTEVYSDGTYPIAGLPALYPRMFLLPNGTVMHAGPEPQVWVYTAGASPNWTPLNVTNDPSYRTYGSNVMLPLSPKNNYDAVIMLMGGMGDTAVATDTTELLDTGKNNAQWVAGPNMSQPRVEMNAVLLPNGQVLALGGSSNDEDTSTASYNVDLYDPVKNTFTKMAQSSYPHLYHSTAVLLPDATAVLSGGNPNAGSYEPHIEVFQPPYLFNTDGTLATRPTVTGVPASITYGQSFNINATDVSGAVMIREGAATHAFDMSQREIVLNFTSGTSTITLTAPPNGNVAPPGYYLLFVLNAKGVPSVGQAVQIQ